MSEDSGPCPFPFEVPAEQVDDLLVGNFWELTALEGHFELPGDRAGPESVSVKKHPPGPQGPAGGDCVVRPRGQDDGPQPFRLVCYDHHILMPQFLYFYNFNLGIQIPLDAQSCKITSLYGDKTSGIARGRLTSGPKPVSPTPKKLSAENQRVRQEMVYVNLPNL